MKKSILNIGKALNREEQKAVFGGNLQAVPPEISDPNRMACNPGEECPDGSGRACINYGGLAYNSFTGETFFQNRWLCEL